VHCENQEFTGVQHDGGYAEVTIAKVTELVSVPDDLSSVDAAPLLCAGITTFGGIRSISAKAGDLVAILGIGGLGHLAIQYARRMGFEVLAIGRGKDKAELAKKLGAHHYIDNNEGSFGDALQAMGGATCVVSTASDGTALAEAVKGLAPRGSLLALGATFEPLGSPASDLVFSSKSITGSLTGDPATADASLKFSVLSGVVAMVETMPLVRAPEAYARMIAGDVRFRMVLTIIRHGAQHQHRQRSSDTQSCFLKVARARIRNIAAVGCITPHVLQARSQPTKSLSSRATISKARERTSHPVALRSLWNGRAGRSEDAQTAPTRILAGNVGPMAWSKMVSPR
jgi:hypothetical protein